jgi:dTDP-4-amino-4,6-dideoxygalactose transaminase
MSPADVPLVDLSPEWAEVGAEVEAQVLRVLRSRHYVLGDEVAAFESEAAAFLGAGHGVGVSSGTDALVVALAALGIGPGDEVITTSFSFFATAESIRRVGATPRFCDVEPLTLNLDVASVAPLVGPRTRAVLAVHLYGRAADVKALSVMCQDRGLALVEDAAQAFGVRRADRCVGTFGSIGCYSFFPAKPLGGIGDGGLVTTGDADLAESIRRLRIHGAVQPNEHVTLGGNYRLDAIQAAALRVKLRGLEARLEWRRAAARRYDAALSDVPGLGLLGNRTQESAPAAVYALRVMEGRRDALRDFLRREGIHSAIYYPMALPDQPALAGTPGARDPVPEARMAAKEVLALPFYYGIPQASQDRVVECVRAFMDRGA